MRYDLTETAGAWIVRCDGIELSAYDNEQAALDDISLRLEQSRPTPAALSLHFERPVPA